MLVSDLGIKTMRGERFSVSFATSSEVLNSKILLGDLTVRSEGAILCLLLMVGVEVEVEERGGCRLGRCAGSEAVLECHARSNPTGQKVVCVWSRMTLLRRLLTRMLRVRLVDLCLIHKYQHSDLMRKCCGCAVI